MRPTPVPWFAALTVIAFGCIASDLGLDAPFLCNNGIPECPSGYSCVDGVCLTSGAGAESESESEDGRESESESEGGGASCGKPTPLTAAGTYMGNTIAGFDSVTAEGCGGDGAPEAYFRLELAAETIVYLDTIDTKWNTVLSLRSGTCDGTMLACNGDGCGTVQSQLIATAPAGRWFVVVDGAMAGDKGPFTLRYEAAACPGSTLLLPGQNLTGTMPPGPGTSSASCGGGTQAELFFHVASCGNSGPSLATCAATSFDSLLHVHQGSCAGPEVSCTDANACSGNDEMVTLALPRGLHFVVLDSDDLGGGTYSLAVFP